MKDWVRYSICLALFVFAPNLSGQVPSEEKARESKPSTHSVSTTTSASSDAVRYEARWDTQDGKVTTDLLTVHFISQTEGWAAGKSNTIIRTTDEGKSWKRLLEAQDRPDFDEVRFVNSNEGWAKGSGLLLHTSDGGESWPKPCQEHCLAMVAAGYRVQRDTRCIGQLQVLASTVREMVKTGTRSDALLRAMTTAPCFS